VLALPAHVVGDLPLAPAFTPVANAAAGQRAQRHEEIFVVLVHHVAPQGAGR
jgi:hypothetical protein